MTAPTPLPTISVALCTYNSGDYIDVQLRSILDQHLPVTEVVVGDDGSTDGTVERIRSIAAEHPRGGVVRIAFTERAGGVVANFSRTLSACTGDVIALSDHDDAWHPTKTATLVPRLTAAGPRAMIFTDARLIDGAGEPTGRTLFEAYAVSDAELSAIREREAPTALIRRNIITGATAMLTRDLLEPSLPIPDGFVHDEWLAFIAAALGTLEVETTPLTDYRVHGTNQIGVPPSSRRAQVRIAMRARRSRYTTLAARARALHERLASHVPPASETTLALLTAKAAFEDARAHMPASRPARLPGILRRYRRGEYARFTYRPTLERWRDLVQPM